MSCFNRHVWDQMATFHSHTLVTGEGSTMLSLTTIPAATHGAIVAGLWKIRRYETMKSEWAEDRSNATLFLRVKLVFFLTGLLIKVSKCANFRSNWEGLWMDLYKLNVKCKIASMVLSSIYATSFSPAIVLTNELYVRIIVHGKEIIQINQW